MPQQQQQWDEQYIVSCTNYTLNNSILCPQPAKAVHKLTIPKMGLAHQLQDLVVQTLEP